MAVRMSPVRPKLASFSRLTARTAFSTSLWSFSAYCHFPGRRWACCYRLGVGGLSPTCSPGHLTRTRMLKLGPSIRPQQRTPPFAWGIELEVPDFCGRILLVLSDFPSSLPVTVVLDQWVVKHGWRVDYMSLCCFCTVYFSFAELSRLNFRQGTAQILVAGVTIFYPQWVATPWQTCE